MDRRSFLLGTSGLAVSQLLIGCGGKNQSQLNVQLLKGSIPGQVVNQFHKNLQQKVQLKFAPIEQIQDLFQQLQSWQHSPKASDQEGWRRYIPWSQGKKVAIADLVTLGDYWLKAAIEQKLIQPLEVEQVKQWSVLDQKWQKLVQRDDLGNLNPQGKVWGAPYRWGSTVIVYNREKFEKLDWRPRDWNDLWRDELQQRISLLNQPREVIGLVLKKLGKSYNTENLDQIPELQTELQKLNQQVKFYSSNNYLEPLIIGDTWLAVGWSSDIVPLLGRYPQLTVVIPQSGTAIWADLWVRPTGVGKASLPYQWIDFCWQPNIAKQISLLTKSNSPISTNIVASDIQEPLQNLLLTNPQIFQKSEFLLPLSLSATKQYESLFSKLKA
ncbi:spermidine/putrescine-binding periplasmic protein [Cylindrospermum stagnale PCC 7417]|uniref:Spermidine/putrescine-binding periplasmic protein n=1 Tax=Cylindrospermum stagnale PCC 7417 TaxID=56107 RepID=K9X121_9NOST|nr:extracellular solute-binding protein [Cylindrospermum stagnale]AFZ25741.1 spermidine/putrescine-binding periplasmic protein [Cylindrospermum stagnale PCC 7417]